MPAKPTWKELLARSEPLILPCAHDALSARLIERAGFAAYTATPSSARATRCPISGWWHSAR